MTHICVGNITIIGPDNGLSPGRRQAIVWTNAGILLIGPWETNFSEILIDIQTFSFKTMHLKMSSAKWRSLYLGLNALTHQDVTQMSHIMQIEFLKEASSKIGLRYETYHCCGYPVYMASRITHSYFSGSVSFLCCNYPLKHNLTACQATITLTISISRIYQTTQLRS